MTGFVIIMTYIFIYIHTPHREIMTQKTTERQIFDSLNYLIGNSLYTCGYTINATENSLGHAYFQINGHVTSTGLEEIRKVLPKSMRKKFFIDENGLIFYH